MNKDTTNLQAVDKKRRLRLWFRPSWQRAGIGFVGWAAIGFVSGCANAPSPLQPQGPAAAKVATLWWVLLIVATVVFIIVMGLLGYALWRPRRRPKDDGGMGNGRLFIGIGGVVIPAIVLVGVMIYTVGVQNAISTPSNPALTVQIIGHQWWWEVHYPEQQLITANEVHIPVGQPVLFKLTAADVIHSFWAPQLQVKLDLLPGQTNTTWVTADRPGSYRVQCAEFCGLQHAHMSFLIVAEPANQVAAWIANQQSVPAPPTDPLLFEGQQIFLGSACVYCHTIRGTVASGQIGPDLTHIASRQTIGAGLLHNNVGTLSGWTINAQALKPGNQMPPMYLDAPSLRALVAYLESLQ